MYDSDERWPPDNRDARDRHDALEVEVCDVCGCEAATAVMVVCESGEVACGWCLRGARPLGDVSEMEARRGGA